MLVLGFTLQSDGTTSLSAHPTDLTTRSLLPLSDEVSRIAGTLARLSAEPVAPAEPAGSDDDLPEVTAETVKALIRARRERARYLPKELFAEPAWDMMLDLLYADLSFQRVSVSSLCVAAGVPMTTALRQITVMVEKGLLIRRADPHDGRRFHVELAPELKASLHRYFAQTDPFSSQ